MKYHLLKEEQNFLIGHCYLLLHLIKMMIPILKAFVWRTTRDTHACVWEKKRHHWKWPVCLLLCLLAWFWPFRPGYSLSCLCLAFLILCTTWLFLSWNLQSVNKKLSPPGYMISPKQNIMLGQGHVRRSWSWGVLKSAYW